MKKIIKDILKRYRVHILIVFVVLAINTYFLTFPPKIIGEIVDLLYNIEINKELIINKVVWLIGVSVLLLLIRIPWRFMVAYITRSAEKDLKNKIFEHFMKIKMTAIQNIKNGEIMAYFTKDVTELRSLLYRFISIASRIIWISIIATYTMITTVDLKLTLITLCPIIVTTFIVIKLKKNVEKNFRKSQKYFTALSEYVQESTDAIRTSKAYSSESNQFKKFIRRNKLLKQSNNAVDVASTLLHTTINTCFGLCYGIALIYGSYLVSSNIITTGDFIAFNGYISMFIFPVTCLPGIITKFKRAQISYKRLDKLFKLEKEKLFISNNEAKDRISGDIVIKDLSFNYPENLDIVLENINIETKDGQTLGIIGTIGSGKTTLMNLLLKLYPVPDGKIYIGGQDINDIAVTTLRKSICYITQDNFLFSSTLKENISLFRDNYNDEDIEKSTQNAMIYDDIKEMQNGIYTIIGERGIDLSGGQKQRVVISRAFLQKSNIVIFDDTFSALDNKTEECLLKNVKELTKGKTCIIISNRISDIKDADKIIVLDSGNIVEQGNHDFLRNNDGLYNKFYNQQSSKEIAEIL